jgi:hypothetical protein
MNTATTTTFFYQSSIVNYVEVDLTNPLHKELYDLFEPINPKFPHSPTSIPQENIKQATKLMKKIEGFKQDYSLRNTPSWASSLSLWVKKNEWLNL